MRRSLMVAAVVALGLAACGGGGDGGAAEAHAGSASGAGVVTSTSYSYVNDGLDATLDMKGATGTLVVTNGSGADVGEPGIYSLDPATGDRVGATVDGAAPVADGAEGTFRVTFPEGFDLVAAGYVGLELGGEDYGGFA